MSKLMKLEGSVNTERESVKYDRHIPRISNILIFSCF